MGAYLKVTVEPVGCLVLILLAALIAASLIWIF